MRLDDGLMTQIACCREMNISGSPQKGPADAEDTFAQPLSDQLHHLGLRVRGKIGLPSCQAV
jgi:hypothetical protein